MIEMYSSCNNSKSQCELKKRTKQPCVLKEDFVWNPSICAIECNKDCNIDKY